jgi:hypothetical protein
LLFLKLLGNGKRGNGEGILGHCNEFIERRRVKPSYNQVLDLVKEDRDELSYLEPSEVAPGKFGQH